VLKYTHERGVELDRFQTEYQILTILGRNPRIIGLKGYTDNGLYLDPASQWRHTRFSRPPSHHLTPTAVDLVPPTAEAIKISVQLPRLQVYSQLSKLDKFSSIITGPRSSYQLSRVPFLLPKYYNFLYCYNIMRIKRSYKRMILYVS
jgi:hypothetical protein